VLKLFNRLHIETHSACNRRCETCLRQTHPQRKVTFNVLPDEIVYSLMDQAIELQPDAQLVPQFFNEPFIDKRMPEFLRYASKKGFSLIYINTNGEFITPELAEEIDGLLEYMTVDFDPIEQIQNMFSKTRIEKAGQHVVTHYSPYMNLKDEIANCSNQPCTVECQLRVVIGSDGYMRLCCEDIIGEFDLGNIFDSTLEELWFSDKHQEIVKKLSQPGGRKKYPYCSICPRP